MSDTAARLKALLAQRIVVIDGAMGTMLQTYKLQEGDFRGERFRDSAKDLKGNNDVLNLTRPDVVAEIHRGYLDAGADMALWSNPAFPATVLDDLEAALARGELDAAANDRAVTRILIAKGRCAA